MDDDHVEKMLAVIRQNRRLTVREVAEEIEIILRGMYGPTQDGGLQLNTRWRMLAPWMQYNDLNILKDIKIRRLGWAGHIIRMEEERIPRKKGF